MTEWTPHSVYYHLKTTINYRVINICLYWRSLRVTVLKTLSCRHYGKPAGKLSFWLGPYFFRQIPYDSPRKYDAITCCTNIA